MKRKNLLLSFICSMAVVLSLGGLTACVGANSESSADSSAESALNSSPDASTSSSGDGSSSSESSSVEDSASDSVAEGTASYENVSDKFTLKLSEITDEQKSAAYYLNGVTATKGDATLSVSVDLSAVDFTKAGAYEIVYSVEEAEETATSTVYVYDTPVVTAEDATIDWFFATEETAVVEKLNDSIFAKDSFGEDLAVSINGLEKNEYGFYGEGAYALTLTAVDVVGNEATKKITLNMTCGEVPAIENLNIDLSNIAVELTDYEVFVDFDLYATGEDGLVKLTNQEVRYDASVGGTVFTEEYVTSLAGAGEKEFIVVLSNAYTTVSATVTDDQAPAFSYSEEATFAYITGEEFALPQATKNLGCAQAIDVKYTLDGVEYTENPTAAGEYTYAIEFYRGEDKVLTKEYKIVLVDNYGWSANSVKATANGNIAITGKSGDVNAVLSADYIKAQGTYNTIVVKAKVLQESSNQADTDEATGPSLWWIDGSTYALTGNEQYYGVSREKVATGAEMTLTLRVETDGSATFILRNFDGWLEITEMEFLYLDAKLAAQQKLNTNFPGWDYIHHNDPNAYVNGKTYHIGGGNFTLTNLLISDAMAAGYKYVTMRVKMTNATTPIEEIYFTTLESGYNWDYYWNAFAGNEVVVRFDMSKYFDSTDLANSGNNVAQFKGRYIGGNDISAEAIEVELIGFETEDTSDCFVSVPTGGNYTVTGETYAKAVDGSATFAISANENYAIASVTASGDAVVTDNGDGTYTVSNITKDTYLTVTTKKTVHTVTLAESENYTADKYSATVKEGETCTFTISANEGFEIENVTADNATVTADGGTYTVSNVTGDTVINVSTRAAKSSYIITLAAGENYTASFERAEVEKDTEYTFTVVANEGYQISSVTADNATVTASGNSYTLTNILNDTIVTVTAIEQVDLGKKMLSSEGDFWNYFHFGTWGANTWDGKSVNVTTDNFQIQKAFLDDALAQGYTHAKISVSSASSDITSIAMLSGGNLAWNYYWKSYNGNSADVRIDLNAYKGQDYSTLTIEFRNSAGAGTKSSVTVTGIEFYKSEETTSWTKTSNSIYAAYENGKLVIDMLGAGGNPSGISTTTEWWKQYAGACTNGAIRLFTEYLYRNNNSRAPLWGKNGSAVDALYGDGTANSGWRWLNDQNYTEGDTFFFTADAESVYTVEFLDWVSDRNEWSGTSVEKVDEDTIKVTGLEGQHLWLRDYADYVAAGYKTVTITATYASGQLWAGNDVWGDSGYTHSVNSGESKTLELSKMDKFCLYFSAATADAEITVTFNK